MRRHSATQLTAISELAVLYDRNGYVRRQNPARRKAEGCMDYKKGDEVRLVANSRSERARIRQLLRTEGFKPGRPFLKHKQGRQYGVPLYGREQVARFLRKIKETKQRSPARRSFLLTGADAVSRKPSPVTPGVRRNQKERNNSH